MVLTITDALRSREFVRALVDEARRMDAPEAPVKAIAQAYAQIETLDRKITTLMAALSETTAKRPLLEQIERWESERETIRVSTIEEETRLARSRAAAEITESHIVQMLDDLSGSLQELPLDQQRDLLRGFIQHIELDPATLEGRICNHFSALSRIRWRPHGDSNPGYRRERAMS